MGIYLYLVLPCEVQGLFCMEICSILFKQLGFRNAKHLCFFWLPLLSLPARVIQAQPSSGTTVGDLTILIKMILISKYFYINSG